MMTTIKLNMTFSMALNFAAIVLAIMGTLNPVVGALVHNAGSVLGDYQLGILTEMEEKEMTVKIIGLIVGLLVLGAGLYYLVKEKKDPESRKIYGVVSAVGGMLVIGCILSLIL